MPRGKGGGFYNEDDFDDGYDDDYDDDGYEDYDEPVTGPAHKGAHGHKAQAQKAAQKQAAAAQPAHKPHTPASAAASTHVSSLHHHNSYPVSPAAHTAAFDFASPSPDDRARAAGPAGRPTVGISLAPSKTPTVKQQQEAAQARKLQQQQPAGAAAAAAAGGGSSSLSSQHSIDGALHELGELHLSGAAAAGAAGSSSSGGGGGFGEPGAGGAGSGRLGPPWRPLGQYSMEPDLAKDVAAALQAQGGAASRRGLALVVLGHVDAGKSTLMGRLLHELGHVSQKEAHKNARDSAAAGKASFAWAWVLDERPEERARGVTVDVAVARFVTPRHDVTLLDAPGHRDFVPNMISGAAQADAALLLVDGSPGGFEAGFYGEGAGGAPAAAAAAFGGAAASGGQTREHAQLARSLGVEQLAVVVSKLDTCGYSQDRFESIRAQLLPFLRSVGFKEASLQWLPAVGPLGLNLASPPASEPALAAWWAGPTLVQAIDAFTPKQQHTGLPLRLPVHDAFKGRGGSSCVGGKLEAGALRPGSKVLVVPGYETGTVKAMEVNGQDHAPLALAGDAADVTLSGLDVSALRAGAVLCHPDFPVRLAAKFTAQVLVLQVAVPILKGHAVTLHAHTAREAGVVSGLLGLCDAKSGAAKPHRPRCLLSGQTALIEVTPVRPLPLEAFGDFKPLGRVVLREGGRTIAVGVVTGITE